MPSNDHVEISQLTYFEYHRYLADTAQSFKFSPVSESVVSKIIHNFNSKAQGVDGISLDMILMTLPQSLHAITTIINKSLVSGIFPESWKVAVVRPIPKNNNPSSLQELRPISLLPCVSKVLERVVCLQLTKFLEDNNILPQAQSGFRKGRSTSTALLEVVDELLASQDKGMCSILVLLDFSRAFDSINLSLLLSKLAFYGFETNTLRWFHSYLYGRQQYVQLTAQDGTRMQSTLRSVPRGIPQGSILGPILFILYSADIVKSITHCQFHLYADDLQLYYSFVPANCANAVHKVNSDLAQISGWSTSNSLVLNPKKSKFMVIGSRRCLQKLHLPIDIMVGNEPVECVSEARNLGLTMDSHLHFENHVAESVRNCFYRLKLLYRIRPYLSEEIRIRLCETLVLSRLNYCDVVFGPCLLSRTEKLIQRVQNACARFCFYVPSRAHVTPFINASNLLKMAARRKSHLAAILFGIIHTHTPLNLYDKLIWARDRSKYPSRACTNVFCTPKHRSMAFRGSFRFAASRCWNDLPPPIRALKTVHSFKKAVKHLFITEQKK